MQKTLLYVAVLAILGFGVWYFLFSGPGNVFGNKEAGFQIKDTGSIGKIFLADNSGKSVTLLRTDSGWTANGYKVLRVQVNQLLATLAQQQPVRPVPEISHNDVVRSLAGTAYKVELYDKNGKSIRTFYVGGEAGNFAGSYMLMDGANKPYVVNIPGFEGYLQPRYNPDIAVWRDRTIFNIGGEDIVTASVQYAREPLNSFTVKRSGDSINVSLDPQMQMEGKPVNKTRALSYLTFFGKVNAEGIANGVERLDSVISTMPKVATVEVIGKNNYHQKADVYFYPMNKRSKNNLAPITDTSSYYDSDHYYAVINNGKDTVAVQKQMFEKIFRMGYEFFAAQAQPAIKTDALKQSQ